MPTLTTVRGGIHRRGMWKAARRLIPRVSSLAHRSTGDGLLRFGDLTIDPPRRLVLQGERVVDLTPREFALLELFVGNADRVLTRSELYERVWGYDFGRSSNVLGVYVGYLRRKLEAENEPRVIQTARGVGYVLRRVGEDSV